MKKKTEEE